MDFVDPTKAFDSVNRNLLWRLLGKIGCPYNLVNIIRSFFFTTICQLASLTVELLPSPLQSLVALDKDAFLHLCYLTSFSQ